MAQMPHDPRAPILAPADFRRLLREGAVIGAAALASSFAAPPSATFHGLTLAQLAHAFLCRSETHGLVDAHRPPANRKLYAALGLCLTLQGAAQMIGPLRRFLGLGSIGPAGYAAMAAMAFGPLLVNGLLSTPNQPQHREKQDA